MGIHFTELIIIAAIALIVMGPEKFPDFAKIFLRTIKDLRGYMDEVKDEVTKEIRPLEREMRNLSKYSPDKYLDSVMDDKKDAKTGNAKSKTGTATSAAKPGTASDDVPPADKSKESKGAEGAGAQAPPDTQTYGDLNAAGQSSQASSITPDTVPEGSDYVNTYKQAGDEETYSPTGQSSTTPTEKAEDAYPHGAADGAGDLKNRGPRISALKSSSSSSESKVETKKKTRPEDIPPPEPLD